MYTACTLRLSCRLGSFLGFRIGADDKPYRTVLLPATIKPKRLYLSLGKRLARPRSDFIS